MKSQNPSTERFLALLSNPKQEEEENTLNLRETVKVSCFDKQAIIQYLKRPRFQKKIEDMDAVIKLLKTISFFKNQKELTYQDYVIICYNLKYEQFKKDEIIFEYNSVGDKFYIVFIGTVSILIPESITQFPYVFKEVAILKKGNYFGELALITNKARLYLIDLPLLNVQRNQVLQFQIRLRIKEYFMKFTKTS